jgi:hypothetical protein
MLQRTVLLVVAAASWLSTGAPVHAQEDRATVQMRDAKKVEGRIEELASDTLVLRVSLNDQRRIPVRDVALIDRAGGASGLPDNETREATGAPHLLVLSNGSSMKGQLVAIRGGEGSANPNQPRTYVFRGAGGEQAFPPAQVTRVYLGSYPFAPATGQPATRENTGQEATRELAAGADVPGAVRVPATAGWVNTRLNVRKGEMISFVTTGEVQLSDNPKDRAHAAGTPRTAPGAPLPTVYAGALIGRLNTGQPFGIGDQSAVPMPMDGVLFLAVNDDERSDNSGEFVVQLGRVRR